VGYCEHGTDYRDPLKEGDFKIKDLFAFEERVSPREFDSYFN
jgi:hypothetical protein